MKMTELEFAGAQPPVDAYAPTGFRVAGVFHEGAVLLSPDGVGRWSAPPLNVEAAAALLALKGHVDVVLLGLGAEHVELPAEFREALRPLEADPAGFGVDPMASPAACRTYNVLLSEGRRVAAALLPMGDG